MKGDKVMSGDKDIRDSACQRRGCGVHKLSTRPVIPDIMEEQIAWRNGG